MVNDSSCPPGHNTPIPLERSPPVSFKRLLGSTRPELALKALPKALELTRLIRRPLCCPNIDWGSLKLVTDIAGEEIHMKVRRRVAMDFVIHLHRFDNRRHRR